MSQNLSFRPFNSIIAKRREDIALGQSGTVTAFEIVGLRPLGELTIGTLVAAHSPAWLDDASGVVALSPDSIVAIIREETAP